MKSIIVIDVGKNPTRRTRGNPDRVSPTAQEAHDFLEVTRARETTSARQLECRIILGILGEEALRPALD